MQNVEEKKFVANQTIMGLHKKFHGQLAVILQQISGQIKIIVGEITNTHVHASLYFKSISIFLIIYTHKLCIVTCHKSGYVQSVAQIHCHANIIHMVIY